MIKNRTKNSIISEKFKLCNTVFSQTIGLMFSSNDFDPLVFVFDKEKKVPLHMMFVFFSIDVLFLDKNKKVVEMVEGFKPFRFYNPKIRAKYVVELKENAIIEDNIGIGDVIEF